MKPLAVHHLVKDYQRNSKESFRAVDNISFFVSEGECFGLLGPNGAGKSTTISCITGLYPPTNGEVLINGYNAHLQPKLARVSLGVCPQQDSIETEFSIEEQLILHASYFRIPKQEAKKRASYLLERFGLEDKFLSLSDSLSGGMRRRLQVARALMSNPKVLVLDEPTTGLDPEARRILWDIILELRRKGTAVLLTTHYMDEAERLSDRIALMHRGKIFDIGSPEELIKRHIDKTEIEETLRPGVIYKRPPNLEDVFLKLAGTTLRERLFHAYE